MALATTCPQCKTSFKVVPDQLKLRRGMVRCGVCQNIFSGIDFLRYVDDRVRQGGASAAAARQRGGDAESPSTLGGEDLRTAFFMPDTVFQPTASLEPPAAAVRPTLPSSLQAGYRGGGADPAAAPGPLSGSSPAGAGRVASPAGDDRAAAPAGDSRMVAAGDGRGVAPRDERADDPRNDPAAATTPADGPLCARGFAPTIVAPPEPPHEARERAAGAVPGPAPRRRERASSDDPLSPATVLRAPAAEPDTPPDDTPPIAPETDAIALFSTDEARTGFGSRVGALGWLAAGLLAVALLLQVSVGLRAPLAGLLPEGGAGYARLVAPLAALYGPPRDLKQVTIESFELTAGQTADSLAMRALLRNQAGYPVQWPAMELTLTDSAGALLVRKVILPADYLAGEPEGSRSGAEGIGARAELQVRLALEARELTPAGYSVNLFYP